MRRAITIPILFLVLCSVRVLSQQPPTAGSIEGIVVRSDTGEPVAGVQVSLASVNMALPGAPNVVGSVRDSSGEVRQIVGPVGASVPEALNAAIIAGSRPPNFQPVTTGADGKFSFKDLTGGSYRIAATANGFVRTEYGQRSSNSQGRLILVTPGQPVKDAAIRLIATGTVTGRVFDENGQPATGAPVQLLRANYNVQGRTYQAVGTGSADDRGDYRIYGVPPGRYYLMTGTPPGPAGLLGRGGGAATSARFTMVYYPNAAAPDQATPIEVKSGGESTFDMRVRRQTEGFRVRGRVVDSTGSPFPQNVNVMLGYRTFTGGGSFSNGRSFDPATGTFQLVNVPPGDYTVQIQLPDQNPGPLTIGTIDVATAAVRAAAAASRPSAYVPIRVVDKDIDDVVLNLTSGVIVAGRFVVEGQPLSVLPNLQQQVLVFSPETLRSPGLILPAALPAAADGTFQVQGMRPGDYRVTLRSGPPAGFYVKSIQYGGDDILTKPFIFSGSGAGTFEVTFRAGASQVSGNVMDAQSQPVSGIQVVLAPARRNRSDLYRPATTDQNGRFSLAGLAPGEYKLFAWESVVYGEFFDPDFLMQYEQLGRALQVAESSNQTVDLKLIPAP